VEFSIMVREEDINQFASLSGDFSPNHMDEEFMKKSQFGKRIAHGALLVAFMSRASTMIIGQLDDGKDEKTPVSLGYDRIRFIHPVFIDDEITIRYMVVEEDLEKRRSTAKIEVKNQDRQLVCIATHILQWVPNEMST
jgi:3-hydroxybutyryl-CoA dehydratase